MGLPGLFHQRIDTLHEARFLALRLVQCFQAQRRGRRQVQGAGQRTVGNGQVTFGQHPLQLRLLEGGLRLQPISALPCPGLVLGGGHPQAVGCQRLDTAPGLEQGAAGLHLVERLAGAEYHLLDLFHPTAAGRIEQLAGAFHPGVTQAEIVKHPVEAQPVAAGPGIEAGVGFGKTVITRFAVGPATVRLPCKVGQ